MKIKLTFLFAVLYLAGFSQAEWAPIGAEWYYTYREGAATPATGYYHLKSIKDTLIDSKLCKVIEKTLVDSRGNESVAGFEYLYSDISENKVYRYKYDSFYLLYDFTKVVGDTIIIKEPYSASGYDSIVVRVDSVSYDVISDESMLKSQHVSVILRASAWFFGGINTEKLGNQYYFFPNNELDCDGGCPQPLRCYSDNEIQYHLYNNFPCDTLYTHSEILDKLGLRIYPVPFEDFLTIQAGSGIGMNYNVEIFNNSGMLVLRRSSFFDRIVLDMSQFNPGGYILRICTLNEIFVKKIIKI
jgi:hypothetical protein